MNNRVAILSGDVDILNLCKIALNSANIESIILDFSNQDKKSIVENALKFLPQIVFVSSEACDFYSQNLHFVLKSKSKFLYSIFLPSDKKNPDWEFLRKNSFSGYIPYPLTTEKILSATKQIFSHIKSEIEKENKIKQEQIKNKTLSGFIEILSRQTKINAQDIENYLKEKNLDIFALKELLNIDEEEIAKLLAEYLEIKYFDIINPDDIIKNVLPSKFSQNNLVVTIKSENENYIVFPNHFDQNLIDALKNINLENFKMGVASPKTIKSLIHIYQTQEQDIFLEKENDNYLDIEEKKLKNKIEDAPVIYITNKIIESAISNQASDFHLEPKETFYSLRFRIDGDLMEFTKLKKETANMVITRIKALALLDITERRRPQDGAFSVRYKNKKYTLRIATSSTPYGESVVVRIIDNEAKPKSLTELGMYPQQEKIMNELSKASQGIILIAAPTGSGKTTTIYSFISSLDLDKKSLITVEDPVEYKIPKANQQQINEKAGVTFANLLKASVRQDPDILFLGEIRDSESAKIAFDFASTGHLTISTIHTSNATTAIFRLERFSITRQQMAETILAIISQRLIKKLCPYCKQKVKTTKEEKELALKFGVEVPDETYKAIGCQKCLKTGYSGRKAVYEIMKFTPEISDMIAKNETILNIRKYLFSKKEILMPQAALMGYAEGIFDFKQIYERILAEELKDFSDFNLNIQQNQAPQLEKTDKKNTIDTNKEISQDNQKKTILVVDDDPDLLSLISKILISAGYNVETAEDGLDALVKIAKNKYDLVISDLDMPNLNGLKLVETVNSKNLGTKIIMLTATKDETAEQRALEFGAFDYIKKPFKKDVLLLRIKKALN